MTSHTTRIAHDDERALNTKRHLPAHASIVIWTRHVATRCTLKSVAALTFTRLVVTETPVRAQCLAMCGVGVACMVAPRCALEPWVGGGEWG